LARLYNFSRWFTTGRAGNGTGLRGDRAIGRAGIAMQMFEVTFVSIHEGFKMVTDEVYREASGGMIDEKKYKTASVNVVKALSNRGQIATNLEDRFNTLIERRNELTRR
jgi:hypothetical protein